MAPSLKLFRVVVLCYLETVTISNTNMANNLEKGLDSLCTNKELVIRPADKGGGIVVLDRTAYIREMHKIVDDHNTYTLFKGYIAALQTII